MILPYPKDIIENGMFRSKLLARCETDTDLRAEVKELCKQDILFWVNCFCSTKDPRRKPDLLPYITYPYQDEHILEVKTAIDSQEDYLNDKSRDMGASWDILYVFTWFWLFEKGSDFRVGSRKEEYVDKLNDIDTLLEKIRFCLRYQPTWMLPDGFDFNKHAGFMRIVNPVLGNAIVGESANPHFGSGGRRKAILLDEFAKWEESVAVAAWTSTADVTPCRIVISTPVGSSNKFAQIALGTKEKVKKTSLHWTRHPAKARGAYYIDNGKKIEIPDWTQAFAIWKRLGCTSGVVRSPWYDQEAERRSEADLAQEVDIDYRRSGYPFFSLVALEKQRAWGFFQRRSHGDIVPYGKHIRATLVEIDNKIEVREAFNGWLRIFELPKLGIQYIVSADVSEGLAKGDESFLVVREKWTRNVVAAANGLYKTDDDFDLKIYKAAKLYNKAEAAPENNNHGYSVVQNLLKMDVKLYETKRVDKDNKVSIVKPGWTTTSTSRPAMLDQLEEEIRKGVFEIRDEILINQCKTFVSNPKTGKPEADGEFLDDGVIALAIGGAVIKEHPYRSNTDRTDAKQSQRVNELKQPAFKF
ncbi:MAG TPA: hypothetical protein DCL42_10380 [Deltaproteobacteria bacterium]|nr:hypothetical protein [Deltaproteobacteria bacterium]